MRAKNSGLGLETPQDWDEPTMSTPRFKAVEGRLGPGRLIADDPEPQSRGFERRQAGNGIRVEVVDGELLDIPGRPSVLAGGGAVESRPDVFEDPAVILAPGDHATEHAEERQSGDAEPVRPGSPDAGFVDQRFAKVEDDGFEVPLRRPVLLQD